MVVNHFNFSEYLKHARCMRQAQTEYLKHARCMRNAQTEYESCVDIYQLRIKSLNKVSFHI